MGLLIHRNPLTTRRVSLRWLVKHHETITGFTALSMGERVALVAHGHCGVEFVCTFGSLQALLLWLSRPSFEGLKVTVIRDGREDTSTTLRAA